MKISNFLSNLKTFLKPNINIIGDSNTKPHIVEQAEMIHSIITDNPDRSIDVAEGLHDLIVSRNTKVYGHSDFAYAANKIFWGLQQIAKWSPHLPNEILARIGDFLFQDSMKEIVENHRHDSVIENMIIEKINKKKLIIKSIENNNFNLLEYLIQQDFINQDHTIKDFAYLIGNHD
jgi:hypothetical protein